MIKNWKFSSKKIDSNLKVPNKMGFCYAVRFKVMPGFYLTKIGATSTPSRLSAFPRTKIYCLSPPHLNYFENEEKLHKRFSELRIPRKPNGKSQVELFNIDLPYLFKNLPDLVYETREDECEKIKLPNGDYWYKTK